MSVGAMLIGQTPKIDSYTKAETDAALLTKADKATSLSGYGITDAYTKSEVDSIADGKLDTPENAGTVGQVLTRTAGGSAWANSGGGIPSGLIAAWSGAADAVPDGWALCDGENGTPDLRDRFLVGAGAAYAVGDTGGEATVTLTTSEMPSHTHSFYYAYDNSANTYYGAGASHGKSRSLYNDRILNTGGDQAHENRPPYYALCWIMKL